MLWLFLATVAYRVNRPVQRSLHRILSTGNIYSLFFCPQLLDIHKQHAYTMVQSDLKNICNTLKNQNIPCIMIILCHGDFKEQTEKLIRILLYTIEKFMKKRKDFACVFVVTSH
jgi:hypothetical protein